VLKRKWQENEEDESLLAAVEEANRRQQVVQHDQFFSRICHFFLSPADKDTIDLTRELCICRNVNMLSAHWKQPPAEPQRRTSHGSR
jgi:hypothetical protein